jgi:type IV pilus assembly protein PilZ
MYMPFVAQGGLFFATSQEALLGDEMAIHLSFGFHPETIHFVGKVVWITPENAQNGKIQGLGLQFQGKEGIALKLLIEKMLEGVGGEASTYTF